MHSCSLECIHTTRAEKDKSQMFAELNDLRAGVDHLGNEKVHSAALALQRRAVSIRCLQFKHFSC
jgi:hypothetical protein